MWLLFRLLFLFEAPPAAAKRRFRHYMAARVIRVFGHYRARGIAPAPHLNWGRQNLILIGLDRISPPKHNEGIPVAKATSTKPAKPTQPTTPQPTSGADIVVQSLVNFGVDTVFSYPGGAVIPLHQALTRFRDKIRVILPRHEQGGGFAAQGYARSTGKIGVCTATSGPGATNLVTAIADAKLDSVPLLAITGQVGTPVIGTDAFQETPIVEVCRSVTKHHYLVTDVNDIARVMREAFHVATTGRPGPVLVDVPKNVQNMLTVPDYDSPLNLPGYRNEECCATNEEIAAAAAMIRDAKRPVIYAGGGVILGAASEELTALAHKTDIPVTTTLTGIGCFPGDDPLALDMLGMHGSVYANYAVDNADLLLAVGVRFDDRVTGKVSEFASRAKVIHVDIDPSEIASGAARWPSGNATSLSTTTRTMTASSRSTPSASCTA
jgi:acetolactate synthase-1/2/3 large subunit